jgi:hypothetical protein
MRGSVLRAVPGGTRFRLFGFTPEIRPGLTYAAASRLECGGPFCALHLQANSSMFVHFPCFLLSARIVCARRNTVNDSGLPLCLE